ncbi:MAG: DNA mismatch repair protein MutS [Epsilonproteobacteria bacterium]|nr:DNA mismatch repair protein MutS [Campylobacterota bacterium]
MKKNIHDKPTPLMQQYFDIKAQYQDTLLFFQVGDFFELFFDDAKLASSFLAIALTKRGKNKGEDIPLCGIPVHALNHYLIKLIKGGFKVALCEQLSKPQPGTVVERGVTRVLTPGTLTDGLMLDEKSASYLLTLFPTRENLGMVFSELLTAQIFATVIPTSQQRLLESELTRFFPDEIVLPATAQNSNLLTQLKKMGYCTSIIDHPGLNIEPIHVDEQEYETKNWLQQQFKQSVHEQINQQPIVCSSLALLHRYLQKNNAPSLTQFKTIQFYQPDDYLLLDSTTQKHLELVKNNNDGSRKNTLLFVLDQAKTPMGSRTIKKWLTKPLVQKDAITARHEVVKQLHARPTLLQLLADQLSSIADIERIIGRIALCSATLHDYTTLKTSLTHIPQLKQFLHDNLTGDIAHTMHKSMCDFTPLVQLLDASLNDDPSQPYIIKPGFDQRIDQLRNLIENSQQSIARLEAHERSKTGIGSLKIGYNQVTGYYIEVTNTHLDKVPIHYLHQQSLSGRKRFINEPLKNLEQAILSANADIDQAQKATFERIKKDVATYLNSLRTLAQAVAQCDALYSFAAVAHDQHYTQPTFNDAHRFSITQGRHPVVERTQPIRFVPNDTALDDDQSVWVITGPNMGGKSTYLRQVALISIMAQCGSFVPAQAASLGIVDQVFTRIGASDNVADGKSTFMVEMEETALICANATQSSLIILDEVGRGTSTFDGIALAQAILEYIADTINARCLFATHYHELTTLAQHKPHIANYHMACHKQGQHLNFLHTIIPGIARGSFGLDVAKLAHLPDAVIARAHEVLHLLNTSSLASQDASKTQITPASSTNQTYHPALESLQSLDLDELSPKQAFDQLWKLKKQLQQSI